MSRINTLAPRLPLSLSSDEMPNYQMLTTIRQTSKQNLKCLVLTAQGERMMDPDFGVGIKKYLFENYSADTVQTIRYNINTQVSTYMPFINIINVKILNGEDLSPPDYNKMFVSIKYSISSVGISDILEFNVQNNRQ